VLETELIRQEKEKPLFNSNSRDDKDYVEESEHGTQSFNNIIR